MARKFFYICAGMFLLALSYHLGASTANAQLGSAVAGVATFGGQGVMVVTASGETYFRVCSDPFSGYTASFVDVGNFWSGSPTPAQHESWGQLKSRYAPNGGTVSKGADAR
jgi:hypothetical protein